MTVFLNHKNFTSPLSSINFWKNRSITLPKLSVMFKSHILVAETLSRNPEECREIYLYCVCYHKRDKHALIVLIRNQWGVSIPSCYSSSKIQLTVIRKCKQWCLSYNNTNSLTTSISGAHESQKLVCKSWHSSRIIFVCLFVCFSDCLFVWYIPYILTA